MGGEQGSRTGSGSFQHAAFEPASRVWPLGLVVVLTHLVPVDLSVLERQLDAGADTQACGQAQHRDRHGRLIGGHPVVQLQVRAVPRSVLRNPEALRPALPPRSGPTRACTAPRFLTVGVGVGHVVCVAGDGACRGHGSSMLPRGRRRQREKQAGRHGRQVGARTVVRAAGAGARRGT